MESEGDKGQMDANSPLIPPSQLEGRRLLKRPTYFRTSSLPEADDSSSRVRSASSASNQSTDKELFGSDKATVNLTNTSNGVLDTDSNFSVANSHVPPLINIGTSNDGIFEEDEVFKGESDSVLNQDGSRSRTDSREKFNNGLQFLGPNLQWSTQHELIVDINNVPQIDKCITPPLSPSPSFINNNNKFVVNPTSLKHLRRKFTSLKFKRNRPNNLRYQHRASLDNIQTGGRIPKVTLNDGLVDEDVMQREGFFKKDRSGAQASNGPPGEGGGKVHFIGDETSLYGTPKEDLSPTKDMESQRVTQSATNYLKDQIISFFQPSDNKLAMKLFGNKNALMKEKLRQKAAGNWVIHPCSNFRSV
jgi:hypothetical protein